MKMTINSVARPLAAEKVARDVVESTAGLGSGSSACSIASDRTGSSLENHDKGSWFLTACMAGKLSVLHQPRYRTIGGKYYILHPLRYTHLSLTKACVL